MIALVLAALLRRSPPRIESVVPVARQADADDPAVTFYDSLDANDPSVWK